MADPRFDALKAAFDGYAAKVDAYVTAAEAFKAAAPQMVADAVAADDAEEDSTLGELHTKIQEAADKVPAPPAAPTT
jgi:hypothetical protein